MDKVRRMVLMSMGVMPFAAWSRVHAAETRRVEISRTKAAFEPAEITVKAGDTVRWRNQSLIEHSVVCDPAKAKDRSSVSLPTGAAPFDSGPFSDGATFEQLFTTPGTYVYFCREHEAMGMVGKVTVNA